MKSFPRVAQQGRQLIHHRYGVSIYLVLMVLAMFGDILFFPNNRALSIKTEDFATQFFYFYDFGFRELRHGNLPLWNPHVFSGTPWFGNFESALLYPPQWIYLVLPAGVAVNWFIAFHVFLLGWFASLWARHYRLHPVAQLVTASCAMFGSAYYFRIMPGHTTIIAAQSWLPLLLYCVDKLLDGHSRENDIKNASLDYPVAWTLCGIIPVAMQLLAGHPQTVFRSGVVVIIYSAFRLLQDRRQWSRVFWIPLLYIGAASLAAAQLGAGWAVASESTRQGAVSLEFAALFPFPPENIITLLLPSFFGNYADLIYWGRSLPWEATLYIGVAGIGLALYGTIFGRINTAIQSRRYVFAVMVLLLFLLALGNNTPLFYFLYAYIPGFNKFRTSVEYIFPISIFLALLAGIGLDSLLSHAQRVRWVSMLLVLFAGAAIFEAFLIEYWASQPSGGVWGSLLSKVRDSKTSIMSGMHSDIFLNPTFLSSAADYAFTNLVIAAGVCILFAFLIYRSKYSRRAVYVIALLAIVEVFGFARLNRPSFSLDDTKQPMVSKFMREHRGDGRVLNLASLNSGMTLNTDDIWGYDPVMLKRYVDFMAWTQGQDPDQAVITVDFKQYNPLYRILRHQYTFVPNTSNRQQVSIAETSGALPRFVLINKFRVLPDRNQIFAAMQQPGFDPTRMVFLEDQPSVKPSNIKTKILHSNISDISTDHFTIDLEITEASILLITDSYSRHWKAVPLSPGGQNKYEVLPANYILRAVPLQKGRHHFRLEYLPQSFVIGKWISIVTLMLYLATTLWWYSRRKITRS